MTRIDTKRDKRDRSSCDGDFGGYPLSHEATARQVDPRLQKILIAQLALHRSLGWAAANL